MGKALEKYVSSLLGWMNVGVNEVTLIRVAKHSVTFLFEREGVTAKRITFRINGEM